jgi:hypothetical protein
MTRKSPGPACRVCGCTEWQACSEGCWWVKVEPEAKPLCSACSGTADDMADAVKRSVKLLDGPGQPRRKIDLAVAIGRAAIRRRNVRFKAEGRNPDPAWGNR